MTLAFLRAVASTLQWEGDGGGDAVEGDAGGPTRWGITAATLRSWAPSLSVHDFSLGEAVTLYWHHVWCKMHLHEAQPGRENVATKVFDQAVLCGESQAARWLQDGLRRHGAFELCTDGRCGPKTIAALNTHGDEAFLLPYLMREQADHHRHRVQQNQEQAKFLDDKLRRANWDPRVTRVN